MSERNDAAVAFLKTRRSRPYKTLTGPAPDRATVMDFLTTAARSPDHGKLEPWRFMVLERPALTRLAGVARVRGAELGHEAEQIEKIAAMFELAPLSVAVIAAPKPSDKIPQTEQLLSAGAVCLALLNTALASGWGANWLSGWTAHDRPFLQAALGLEAPEFVAGFVHLGTATTTPPDRPRPDINAITDWVEA